MRKFVIWLIIYFTLLFLLTVILTIFLSFLFDRNTFIKIQILNFAISLAISIMLALHKEIIKNNIWVIKKYIENIGTTGVYKL